MKNYRLNNCDGCKNTVNHISNLFETYCEQMIWGYCLYDIRSFWRTLKAFCLVDYDAHRKYLQYVYDNIYNNKEKIDFSEFYDFLTK